MILINCGCGNKYHDDWINIDFASDSNKVIQHNLLTGLPFENDYADFLYNCNFLEHLTLVQAERFLKECFRVLKKGACLRIVVPDLENVCKKYLEILELCRKDPNNYKKYEYILIELIDQMTRDYSGGLMGEYWQNDCIDKEFIIERHGDVFHVRNESVRKSNKPFYNYKLLKPIKKLLTNTNFYKTYKIGKYNISGEKHKWMYDSFGIERLLCRCGFKNISVMNYNHSSLEKFAQYHLEVDSLNKEYKPNCLYVEAFK